MIRVEQSDEIRSALGIAIYDALRTAEMEIPFDQNFHPPSGQT